MSEELENKEFDRSVQNKISEHKTSVPDYLWTNINTRAASLETESLRKRIVWYKRTIVSLLLILVGVVLFYQFGGNPFGNEMISEVETKKQLNGIENENPTVSEKWESVPDPKKEKEPTTSFIEEVPKVINKQKNVSEEFLEENSLVEIEYTKTSTDETKSNLTNEVDISKDNYSSQNVEASIIQKKDLLSNEIQKSDKKEVESQESKIVKEEDGNKSPTNQEGEEQENISGLFVENEIKKDETDQNLVIKNKVSVEENNDNITAEVLITDKVEEVALAAGNSDSSLIDSIVSTEIASDIPAVTPVVEEKSLSKITTTLFVLPNFSYPGFEAASGTHDIYKTTDGTKLRLSFGANVGYSISDKLTLRLGLTYHQSKTEIELNDRRPKELPIMMDPANSSITIYSSLGTVVANDIGNFSFAGDDEDDIFLDDEDDFASLNFREEQEFFLLDIPVTVGCEMGKGRLKLLLEGGIITTFLTKAKSKIEIANVYSPDVLVSIEDYHQTKKMVLGGTVGLGLKYNISRRFSIIGLPTYNTSFMDINENDASKIKPNSFNFSLGLQFQF